MKPKKKSNTRHLNLVIEAGEGTCASKPGQFCRYMRVANFGTRYLCGLFSEPDGAQKQLQEKDGWIRRCDDCLGTEQTSKYDADLLRQLEVDTQLALKLKLPEQFMGWPPHPAQIRGLLKEVADAKKEAAKATATLEARQRKEGK